jgi:triosephosphate isomerase
MNAPRKIFIGGNWKSNGSVTFTETHSKFLSTLSFETDKCEVVVAPTFLHLSQAKSILETSLVKVAAQNVSATGDGAFTGEISAQQILDLGVNWVIIGHSERRQHYHENDELVGKKVGVALKGGLNVIACIGEKLDEREANKTLDVLFTQLSAISKNVSNWNNVVVAYEPVWAIGTGKSANAQQVQEVHSALRKWVKDNVGENESSSVRIIYGGSVTDSNSKELVALQDVDGFLVGGASLKEGFKTIVESYKSK